MVKLLQGCEKEAFNAIKNIKGVKDLYPILGEYGLFVVVKAENISLLYSIVNTIKELPEVASNWHLLISKDHCPSDEKLVWEEINRFEHYDSNVSKCCGAANLGRSSN